MESDFTCYDDAIEMLADSLGVGIPEATFIYEFSECPAWDNDAFLDYDFENDPVARDFL